MHYVIVAQLLILLATANFAPIAANRLFGKRGNFPLDGGIPFFDGKPLLGPSKTVRGLLCALAATSMVAPLIGLSIGIGAMVAALAMFGDSLSSFTKRRLRLDSSSMALGLDQIPESLLPPLACLLFLPLGALDVLAIVLIFFFGELVLSKILFRLHVREQPY
jgi:CDP-2,3-bis-(O-geranylgeranyl)-sn-glycerol synthase